MPPDPQGPLIVPSKLRLDRGLGNLRALQRDGLLDFLAQLSRAPHLAWVDAKQEQVRLHLLQLHDPPTRRLLELLHAPQAILVRRTLALHAQRAPKIMA